MAAEAAPVNRGQPRIWCIVSCKGRLAHLRHSLRMVLAQRNVVCCLVDYDCPERCGDWAAETFPDALRARRLVIERIVDRPLFNKSAAQNAGAARAIEAGADHLVFTDADTLLGRGLLGWLRPRLDATRFWVAARRPDGYDEKDVYGFLVVPAAAFVAAGRFDESFEGWGAEDLDLRLRLVHGARLEHGDVPLRFLSALAHADDLRTAFYQESDTSASNLANQKRMYRKLHAQFGLHPFVVRLTSYRMWCRCPSSRPPGNEQSENPSTTERAEVSKYSEYEQLRRFLLPASRLAPPSQSGST